MKRRSPARPSRLVRVIVAVFALSIVLLVLAVTDDESSLAEPRQVSLQLRSAEGDRFPPGSLDPSRELLVASTANPLAVVEEVGAVQADPTGLAEASERVLQVTIVDAAGKLVADALLECFTSPERGPLAFLDPLVDDPVWGEPLGRWISGSDGRATLSLPPGELLLRVTHEQHGSSGVRTLASVARGRPPGRLTIQLSPLGTLRGRVLTVSGQPATQAVASFSMFLSLDEDDPVRPRLPRPVEVDADGRFTVQADTGFTVTVSASMGDQRTIPQIVFVGHRRATEVELRFPGAFVITGVVVDPEGTPVAGAHIDLAGFDVLVEAVSTNDRGAFRILLPQEGRFGLIAQAGGWVQDHPVVVTVDTFDPVADAVLLVVPAATIAGRVERSDGSLVGPGSVSARVAKPVDDTLDFSRDPVAWMASRERRQDDHDFFGTFRLREPLDAEGRFRLEGIHPAFAVDLGCTLDDGQRTELKGVLPGDEDVLIVVERMAPGTDVLAGSLLDDETGTPVEVYELRWGTWEPKRIAGVEKRRAIDDPAGRFELDGLQPERAYGLEVEAVGYPRKLFGPFTPSVDGDLELRIGRPASLTVTVTDRAGKVRPDASVQLMPGERRSFAAIFTGVTARAVGPDGTLTWSDLKPGMYTVEAAAGILRSSRQRVELQPGQQAGLVLFVEDPGAGATLEIQVTRKDGIPWAGAQVGAVLLIDEDEHPSGLEPFYSGVTDGAGLVSFVGLDPGDYIVSVSTDETRIPLKLVAVPDAGTVSLTIGRGGPR